MLQVAVEEDDGRAVPPRVEGTRVPAAEGERCHPAEHGRRHAFESEGPDARRPRRRLVVVAAFGGTPATIGGSSRIGGEVERERTGRDQQRDPDDNLEHDHAATTTRLARRVKCKLAFPGNAA